MFYEIFDPNPVSNDEDTRKIVEALKSNKTLIGLKVTGNFFLIANEIGVKGAESIAEVLKVNSTLQTLDLRCIV